jgi:hypothetical protein
VVEVIVLKYGELAPEIGDRIVIVHDARACMMTVFRGDSILAVPECWPLDQMVERARKEAETLGIGTIYVREAKAPRVT